MCQRSEVTGKPVPPKLKSPVGKYKESQLTRAETQTHTPLQEPVLRRGKWVSLTD